MNILKQKYLIQLSNGENWMLPVEVIAKSRATYYSKVDNVSFEESLINDTEPTFGEDEYEIHDWAMNNMDWKDVSSHVVEETSLKKFGGDSEAYQKLWLRHSYRVCV